MSGWPKIFRDPVHSLIAFDDNDCDKLLLALIDTKEVQRLRRIKQLGFTELVFPGANHSRFAHSIGVLHIAKKFLDQFDRISGKPLEKHQRTLVLAASLLHDIGHGPFSHTFEKVTGQKHEIYTRQIILDSSTEVHQTLIKHDLSLPDFLAKFFSEGAEDEQSALNLPVYLTQVISSQLDADRCDYLLRDSHATGTNYGDFDLDWLLTHIYPQSDGKRFYLSRKALSATEAYIFARFHMYRTVYYHKTTRSAEVMLKLIFRRFDELLKGNKTLDVGLTIVPNAPINVITALTGQMNLSQYLTLDDFSITEFLKACESSPDPVLSELSKGILNRKLYKAIDATGVSGASIGKFTAAVQLTLSGKRNSDYLCVDDSPGDLPYKPYDVDQEKPDTQIYVEDTSGKVQEIGRLSRTVAQLREPYEMVRYYFPETLRDEIRGIAKEHLKKA